MKKFEYKEYFAQSDLAWKDDLAKFGEEGWGLVSVTPFHGVLNRLVFKREKIDPPSIQKIEDGFGL